MKNQCVLQLYLNYSSQDVASLSLFDPPSRGWQAKNHIAYTTNHAIDHMGKQDASAVVWNLPVTLDATQSEQWPGFAPIVLHPDGIARTTRWDFDDLDIPLWQSVISQVAEATGLDTAPITQALCAMAEPLRQLPEEMKRLAVDDVTIERFSERCKDISDQLGALKNG